MNKLLSSHSIMSPETQAVAVATYKMAQEALPKSDRKGLKKAIEFALAYYERVGMLPGLDELTRNTSIRPDADRFEDETEVLYELRAYQKRIRIYALRNDLHRLADIESTSEMVKQLTAILGGVSTFADDQEEVGLAELLDELVDRATSQADEVEGAVTGIYELDREIAPIAKGTLLSVCAAPSHGKSTFAYDFIYRNSILGDYRTLFLSLEIPKGIAATKLLVRHDYERRADAALAYSSIRRRQLSSNDVEDLLAAREDIADRLDNVRILDLTDSIPLGSPLEFGMFLEQAFARAPFDILVVDYLQISKSYSRIVGYENYEYMNGIVSMLRRKTVSIGQGQKLTTLLLSQTNRVGFEKAGKNNGKYESLSSIAEANGVERDSQMVVFLHLSDTTRASSEIRVQLLKNRDGELIEEPIVTSFEPDHAAIGDVGNSSTVLPDLDAYVDGNPLTCFYEEVEVCPTPSRSSGGETIDYDELLGG